MIMVMFIIMLRILLLTQSDRARGAASSCGEGARYPRRESAWSRWLRLYRIMAFLFCSSLHRDRSLVESFAWAQHQHSSKNTKARSTTRQENRRNSERDRRWCAANRNNRTTQ